MNKLVQICTADDILLDVAAGDKSELLETAGRFLARRHGLDPQQVNRGLIQRERLGSTGLGQGVAIPHARLEGCERIVAALIRPRLPVEFDAPDGRPVGVLLTVLVPQGAEAAHLQYLATAAGMLCDRDFRQRLKSCDNAGEIYRLLSDWR